MPPARRPSPDDVGAPSSSERLRALIDAVGDGIVTATGDSRIVGWNRAAARLFGWSEEEVLGRSLTDLMPERHREAHLAGIARLRETGEARLIGGGAVELEGLRRDGTEFPLELTLGAWRSADGDDVYTGVVRDVSDRRELERYRSAQYAVAAGLAEASTVAESSTAALGALGQVIGWPLGAMWLVDEEAAVLRCIAVWQAEGTDAAAFERLSLSTTLTPGVGLPGRVWAGGEMAWIDDVLIDGNFPRIHAAAEDGLHAAIGMPLVAEHGVLGVLEFFNDRIRAPSVPVMDLMATVGEQIGQVIQRHRAEDRLADAARELDRRRDAERHAQQINAHVIHHLVQASDALDQGDLRRAQLEMHRTLDEASRIVTELGVRDAPAG
jgi:PAS domain S-box-containing protein